MPLFKMKKRSSHGAWIRFPDRRSMDARALRRKDAFRGERPWGERASVIHGSPIGKPYPSSVASLRSLYFSNLAN
ncbi:hypothetical protein GQ55_8G132700 [Panicum hallii var. hallii]|uniref:Uncharacterized protein n=1 Tax=Panicum hallii var. hallii TaxID=1504633 RepID=A0A2T7CMY0_9POAL|nr:hypothetical protein GQ55_8G132700 [Panicum hallii var. hallii]